ncbi:hypothetical protein [Pseudomonas sp. CF10PS3]
MSAKQKGLLAIVPSEAIQRLNIDFYISYTSKKPLEDLTFRYIYLTSKQDGFGRELNAGLICTVESVNISKYEDTWKYTFELGEALSRIKNPGNLFFEVEKKHNWEIFEWDFEKYFTERDSGVDDYCKTTRKRPSLDIPLTIEDAISQLAGTYGIERSKLTISITG